VQAHRAPRIVVDERERNSGIPELLRQSGATVDFSLLSVGDYVVSTETAVERKTVHDLINSIYDGRLFIQCSELVCNYKKPVVLIQGDIRELLETPQAQVETEDDERADLVRERIGDKIPLAYDSLSEIILNFRIPIIHVADAEQAAQFLVALVNQSLKEGLASGPLLRKIRKENPIQRQQLSVLASVPGIGEKLASRMLAKFSTPQRALNASVAELATIQGFGLARAQRVRRILDIAYDGTKSGKSPSNLQSKLFGSEP
jgi:DNA excision repair protein ERCC-4